MMLSACVSDSIGSRDCISARRRGAIGWPFSQGLLITILLIAPLIYLSGCGPGQTDVGQTNGNNVPVNLNISMPQESAAASTRGNRFWATVQSWLPTPTSAWAQNAARRLVDLRVDVTDSNQQPLATSTRRFSQPPNRGDLITFDLDVPAGPERVFTVSGFDPTGETILQGQSTPITLTPGQAATVNIILNDKTTPTITGTVINAETGAPLFDATVSVNGRSLRDTTNRNGTFTLNGVPLGQQTLTVSAAGFTSTTRTVTVVAGTVSAGTIALTPLPTTGAVTGTVTNAGTGTPLPNATVAVTGTSLRTTTNSDGNFTLNGVLQGRQTLAVSASGFTATTRDVTVMARTSISTGTIALKPIDNTGTVTGTVTNAETGAPLFRATVAVNGTKLSIGTLDDGTFTLNGIPEGRRTLTISASGFTATTRDVTVVARTSISAGTIVLTTPLPTTGSIDGTVIHAFTETPLQFITIAVNGLSTTSSSNGSFVLRGVPVGPQTVTVSAPQFNSTTRTVEVPADGSVSTGTIALTPSFLDFSGTYFGTEVRSNEDRFPIKIVIQQTDNIASVSIFYPITLGFPDIPQLAGSTEVVRDRFSITFRQSLGNDAVFIDTWDFQGNPPSVLQFTRNLINNPNGFHRSTGFLRPG